MSLRQVAAALTDKLGYKVLRTVKQSSKRKQYRYGHSVNKLEQYKWFKEQGLSALEFTENPDVAAQWLTDGFTVFGRQLLNSSCGKGIVVLENPLTDPEEALDCPVFTKYKKKKREFRVHVFAGTVVAVLEKRRKKEFQGERDTKIRNLANGYVFCQEVVNVPEGLRELALAASQVSSSDFAGVDIGFNERSNELFIIEVNSAPGITGTNIHKYTQIICDHENS
jgi:glutathione synthase/RimK-type ligase-like ATP-grasp enzyme